MKPGRTWVAVLGLLAMWTATPAMAADECGRTHPSYTATRTIGPLRLQIVNNGRFEREQPNENEFTVTDTQNNVRRMVNLREGTVREVRLSPPPAAAGVQRNAYVDKTNLGGGRTLVEGGIIRDGQKIWVSRTVCRSDGIFEERTLIVPNPQGQQTVRATQSNIRVGNVPADAFTVPSGLRQVR